MHNTLTLVIALGIGFAWAFVPLALVASRTIGCGRLKSLRRYVIVLNLIVAALLTTPEVLTQVLAALVLQVIYEVTVLIACYGERREKNRRPSV